MPANLKYNQFYTLKTKSRHHANFVVTGGTVGCHNENIRCHQKLSISVYAFGIDFYSSPLRYTKVLERVIGLRHAPWIMPHRPVWSTSLRACILYVIEPPPRAPLVPRRLSTTPTRGLLYSPHPGECIATQTCVPCFGPAKCVTICRVILNIPLGGATTTSHNIYFGHDSKICSGDRMVLL